MESLAFSVSQADDSAVGSGTTWELSAQEMRGSTVSHSLNHSTGGSANSALAPPARKSGLRFGGLGVAGALSLAEAPVLRSSSRLPNRTHLGNVGLPLAQFEDCGERFLRI